MSWWKLEILLILSKYNVSDKSELQIRLLPINGATVIPSQLYYRLSPQSIITLTARHLSLNGWELLTNKPRLPLPIETPQCDPQRLMLLSEMAAIRIWSNARVKKVAKVLAKATVLSRVAQPTAMLTWKKGDCTRTVNSSFIDCFQEIICGTSYRKTLARSSQCRLKISVQSCS